MIADVIAKPAKPAKCICAVKRLWDFCICGGCFDLPDFKTLLRSVFVLSSSKGYIDQSQVRTQENCWTEVAFLPTHFTTVPDFCIYVCLLLWSPFLISIKEECEGSGNPPDGIHFCLVLFRQQQGRERDPLQSESRRGTGTLLVERWRHTEKGKCWKGFSGSATVFIQVGWWDRRIWFEVSAPKNCSVTKGEIPFIWPHVLRNLNGFDFESLHSLHLWSLLRNLLWSTRSREISARISCGLWCWIFLFI